jgi:hypothetical protein
MTLLSKFMTKPSSKVISIWVEMYTALGFGPFAHVDKRAFNKKNVGYMSPTYRATPA